MAYSVLMKGTHSELNFKLPPYWFLSFVNGKRKLCQGQDERNRGFVRISFREVVLIFS